MKKLELTQMENVEGGLPCGVSVALWGVAFVGVCWATGGIAVIGLAGATASVLEECN